VYTPQGYILIYVVAAPAIWNLPHRPPEPKPKNLTKNLEDLTILNYVKVH